MAISQDTLLKEANEYRKRIIANESYDFSIDSRPHPERKSAFLCHSHDDEDIVEGIIGIFKKSGLSLYVDWQDHSMPETPNAVTAKKIQDKIISSDLFLFLATGNSMASRWCPWEIGFADSMQKNIYIIPTENNYNTYGNEYLDLYPYIDSGYYKKVCYFKFKYFIGRIFMYRAYKKETF